MNKSHRRGKQLCQRFGISLRPLWIGELCPLEANIFGAKWNLQCTRACRRILRSLDSSSPIKRRIHSLRHLKQLSSRYVVQFRSEKLTLRETWRLLLEKQMVAVKIDTGGKVLLWFPTKESPLWNWRTKWHVLLKYTNNKRDSILGFSAETMLLDLLQFEL